MEETRPYITKLLKSVLNHPYGEETCFTCAEPLTSITRTEEHIFPKWRQEKHNLWDHRLSLCNNTLIQYRNLKVPCCKNCNNEKLAKLEQWIENKISAGYDACKDAPELPFFRWLSKIFMGILSKETYLLDDRKNPNSDSIVPVDHVKSFGMLHFWLNVATKLEESEFCPGSLFVFPAQVPQKIEHQFDFMDDSINGVVAIRIGEVFLVVDFLEWGLHKKHTWEDLRKYTKYPLHPLQAREIFVKIAYQARLLELETEINFYGENDNAGFRALWKSSAEGNSLFNHGDIIEYSKILAHYTRIPFEMIYYPEFNTHATWLEDQHGNPVFWKLGTDLQGLDSRTHDKWLNFRINCVPLE